MEAKERIKSDLADAILANKGSVSVTIPDLKTLLSMMPEWVKCSERLPEEGLYVLCATSTNGIGGASKSMSIGCVNENGRFSCAFDWTTVTHWRELPKQPTE